MVQERPMHSKHYIHLAIMTVLMFIAMYILMYAIVDRLENVFPNINQFYMAGLMTAPMVLIELAIMRAMYENRMANIVIIVVSLIALVGFWVGIRQQVAVTDEQFLKSMIPHHAGAILMCKKASIQDSEIQSLCREIIRGQQSEIAQMRRSCPAEIAALWSSGRSKRRRRRDRTVSTALLFSVGASARSAVERHFMHLGRPSSCAYSRMEVLSHPPVAAAMKHEPAARRDLNVEVSRDSLEPMLPPRPCHASAVLSNDNCD